MVTVCFCCKKKLKIAQVTIGKCKCGYVFCNAHIHNHTCSHDFKTSHQSQLKSNMPVIEHTKVGVV